MQLKPYPEYKESGVPWLGTVPRHWDVLRSKYVLREIDVRSTTGQEVHLSMSQKHGLIPSSEIGEHRLLSETYVGAKLCEPYDLVLNRLKAHLGVFALAKQRGLVSPDYTVFRPRPHCFPHYFVDVLRTPLCRSELRKRAKGIVEGFWRLYTEDFYQITLPVPPSKEQRHIVDFLETHARIVARLINSKRRLIELLNEQKQAIIHQAVTRGLDPNVRMKPSGIDWLGEVPEHWQVSRLKFETAFIVDCLHATPEYRDDGMFPAIRTADVTVGKLHLQKAKRVSQQQYDIWTSRLVPKGGDTLYTREGERYGIAATVPEGIQLCISQRMMIFRARDSINSKFLMWQLNCGHIYAQASEQIIGAAAPHINIERIKNYKIILPPKNEQEQIDSWITQACDEIHNGIEKIVREIDLLREYRTRLIADVVTGKLDVRGVRLDEAVIEKDLLEDFEENEAEMDSDKEIDAIEGLDE